MLIIENLCNLQVNINDTENAGFFMIRYSIHQIIPVCFLLIVYLTAGCSNSGQSKSEEYLIKVGDQGITVSDFNRAFEIAKAAYPYKSIRQPATLREIRLRLFQQMTEEMLLLERAKELGIKISETEIKKTIEDLKKDYPDKVFEDMLVEYAVPYSSWEKRLKTRLLMEKVIDRELGDHIKITSYDMANYYEEHSKDDGMISDVNGGPKKSKEIIIKNLRRQKMEKAYPAWIKRLKKKYPIEINEKLWAKIDGFTK